MRDQVTSQRIIASDSAAKPRVLVVGYGLIGRQRVKALAELSNGSLAGTVDPVALDPSATTGQAHFVDIAEVPPQLYDAAIIAAPHDIAVYLATAALEAGRPVLVEKPLGVITTQARRLEDLAGTLSTQSFVGYNYRFLPAMQMILQLVSSGELGALRNVDLFLGHGGHARSAESWKLDPSRAGGGVLLDPGVHLFDLLLSIAPDVECTDIQAASGFWPTGIEEDVIATFRQGQMLATVRTSHIRWVNTFRVEITGEDGYAIAEGRGGNYGPMRLRVGRRWAWSKPGATSQRDTEDTYDFGSHDGSLRDELSSVLGAWRDESSHAGAVHPATMAEGRAVTELCEQLYERLETLPGVTSPTTAVRRAAGTR
jgi:1,5-anhydro-D-fructose reductase (1,5-anhydro-D-mannitol-forming)